MERQAHYAAVGLVTLVLAAILLGFAFWFIKFDFNKDYGVYDVEFNQPVDWLNKGAEVHFNGIKVGEVTSLRLGKPGTHQVFARVQLDAGTPVRTDSVATLMPQGITGLLYTEEGAFLQAIEGPPDSMSDLLARLYDDERHHALEILVDRSIEQREFGDWTMIHRERRETTDSFDDRLRVLLAGVSAETVSHFRALQPA